MRTGTIWRVQRRYPVIYSENGTLIYQTVDVSWVGQKLDFSCSVNNRIAVILSVFLIDARKFMTKIY